MKTFIALFNIKLRLWLSMAGVLVILIYLGIIGQQQLNKIATSTNNLYKHPYTTSNAVREIQYRVAAIDRNIGDMILARHYSDVEVIQERVLTHEKNILIKFDLVEARFLGDLSEVKKAREIFEQWRPFRQSIIQFMADNKRINAAKVNRNKGGAYVEKIEQSIRSLLTYADNKALIFLALADKEKEQTIQFYWFLVIGLSLLVITAGLLMIRNIIPPVLRLTASLEKMSYGNLNFNVTDLDRNDEMGVIARSLDELKNSTMEIAEQAEMMAENDFSFTLAPRSEDDLLGKSMAEMSMALNRASFVSEGIGRLNDLIRGNLTIEELSRNIIAFVCQHVNSQVGCFHIVKENRITPTGGYVFDYKNASSIAFGEGYVGESARQNKIMRLDKVPTDYMDIDTATGMGQVSEIMIIPIVWNDQVVALIELGLQDELAQNSLAFIEAANGSIAVTVTTALLEINNN